MGFIHSKRVPHLLLCAHHPPRECLQPAWLANHRSRVVANEVRVVYPPPPSFTVALELVQASLSQLSLDHLVVCGFYAICRLYGLSISFHHLLDMYTGYLTPYRAISNIVEWGDVNTLWFGVRVNVPQNSLGVNSVTGTMVELYNLFFVPLVYPAIQAYHAMLQREKGVSAPGVSV